PSLLPLPSERCLDHRDLHSSPTRRSSDLPHPHRAAMTGGVVPFRFHALVSLHVSGCRSGDAPCHDPVWHLESLGRIDPIAGLVRSEEHTSELQSRENLVCRLLLEKKKL